MPTFLPSSVGLARKSAVLGGQQVTWLEREGVDPPALLLHGWGASAASFVGLLRLAKTPRRLLAVDLPGFGESPLGVTEWTRGGYAGLLRDWIHGRDWPAVAVLGHSYGGGVALRLADGPGAPLDRLLLCAPSGLPEAPGRRSGRVRTFRALRQSMETLLPARVAEPAVEWLRQRMGSADYRAAGPLRPVLVRAVHEDLTEVARRLEMPTLIIWGGRDPELPLDPYGKRLRQLIGSSELVEFPRSGHFPFLDEPQRFAAVFDSFVDAKL
ncbi:MAG: alpha/beta fold hydrolase [Candidatus Dormibacteria bacterium]